MPAAAGAKQLQAKTVLVRPPCKFCGKGWLNAKCTEFLCCADCCRLCNSQCKLHPKPPLSEVDTQRSRAARLGARICDRQYTHGQQAEAGEQPSGQATEDVANGEYNPFATLVFSQEDSAVAPGATSCSAPAAFDAAGVGSAHVHNTLDRPAAHGASPDGAEEYSPFATLVFSQEGSATAPAVASRPAPTDAAGVRSAHVHNTFDRPASRMGTPRKRMLAAALGRRKQPELPRPRWATGTSSKSKDARLSRWPLADRKALRRWESSGA